MGKYFGTDGIRNKAEFFTPEFIRKVANGIVRYSGAGIDSESGLERPIRVMIGGDTRESSQQMITDFTDALETLGLDCAVVDVLPTPAINYAFYKLGYDLAIDITASHNPYTDNGIKIFERSIDGYGVKLNAKARDIVENAIDYDDTFDTQTATLAENMHEEALRVYLEHLAEKVERVDLAGLKVCLDCANGATSVAARRIFESLGAQVTVINDDAEYGRGINNGCGSTHLEQIKTLVTSGDFDFGAAFDGDGDRCLLVDKNGDTVDGDQIIAILAHHLGIKKIAVTVMANQGLLDWAKSEQIEVVSTDVGDANVFAAMQAQQIPIGGEQSGHTILPGEPMGDGILTALFIAKTMVETQKSLSELASIMPVYPQVLENIVATPEEKAALSGEAAQKVLAKYAELLAENNGRLLVRPSGTENLIRITIWGKESQYIQGVVAELSRELQEVLNLF